MGYADNEHKTAGIHMRGLAFGCSTQSRFRASGYDGFGVLRFGFRALGFRAFGFRASVY